jgi:hypothetical protein
MRLFFTANLDPHQGLPKTLAWSRRILNFRYLNPLLKMSDRTILLVLMKFNIFREKYAQTLTKSQPRVVQELGRPET